ncbi:unnamed protein product [Litomosoides sigmodontis]|uniref:Uncharacterized protein n=1 Tax=Litomosoides sigmodontis TaxID=42156 RepID=A0A3P6SN38_LITSI|nr:unnamed protein product [Litomosoides sigmodontis]
MPNEDYSGLEFRPKWVDIIFVSLNYEMDGAVRAAMQMGICQHFLSASERGRAMCASVKISCLHTLLCTPSSFFPFGTNASSELCVKLFWRSGYCS